MPLAGRRAIWVRLVVTLLAVVFVGCTSSFRESIEVVAANIGRNPDDVERAFRAALSGSTDAELEAAAARAAADTHWIPSLGAQLAVTWERLATTRAIAGATCEAVDIYADLGEVLTPQQLRDVILYHIRLQQLPETEAKVIEIAQGIVDQLQSVSEDGSVDTDALLVDLACLPF